MRAARIDANPSRRVVREQIARDVTRIEQRIGRGVSEVECVAATRGWRTRAIELPERSVDPGVLRGQQVANVVLAAFGRCGVEGTEHRVEKVHRFLSPPESR